MPAKKDPPLTDEERSRRIRELADEAGTSDDPEAFNRAFEKVVTPDQNGVRTGTVEKPKPVN